jgi:hypothetical protein
VKLFQSIFGRGQETRGRYPESLIEAAIERAVEGTDPRLRVLPGYRKRLRGAVLHAADHVIALVEAIPAPLPAGRGGHGADPRLAAVFASAADMLALFARDRALTERLSGPDRGAAQMTALLLAERVERNVLGMDLAGESVRRDVAQVAVSFIAHRLLDPRASEEESRRQLKRRAFDHLLTLALTEITERRVERADLSRQRDLLRSKLAALKRGGWTFEETAADRPDEATLVAELDGITGQLSTLGADDAVLAGHLDLVAGVLETAERRLWLEEVGLYLDSMNIQRDPGDPSARHIVLKELRNARGQRAVMLPVSIAPSELPEREDLVAAAQRYLY